MEDGCGSGSVIRFYSYLTQWHFPFQCMPKYLKDFLCTMPKKYRQEMLAKAWLGVCGVGTWCLFSTSQERLTHMGNHLQPTAHLNLFGTAKVFLWSTEHHRVVLLTSIMISNSPALTYCWVWWDHPYTNIWDRASVHTCGLTQSSAASPHSSNLSKNRLMWEYSDTN